LHLSAGTHPIEIMASSTGRKPLDIRFNWMTPELLRSGIEKAATAAKSARTAVVFVWSVGGNNLVLPDEQDELVETVAASNPRTIVVLNAGFAIKMPWKDNVRAILDLWYPGQEGGEATANVLAGRVNPGGKLPFTFPAKLDDSPAYAPGHPERIPQSGAGGAGAGDVPLVRFSEGIAVGYRWFDQENIEPLFPFGHGLSYTQFRYSALRISRAGEGYDVSFAITNAGTVKGAEVPQVYVGAPGQPPVPMAAKSLAAFERVELNPGQTRTLSLHVSSRALSYWSSSDHQWVPAPGPRPMYVGSSSRDIRLRGEA
jgi:beta-glucosidase